MQDKLISIIVPVYNVEKYLPRCVDSILAQTYTNFECILIDDGSTDNSGSICDEYAARDKRIKVIHQQNKGLAGARNSGLKIATGVYMGFVDSDDWIEPEMYETMIEVMEHKNCDIVICDYEDFYDDGKTRTWKDVSAYEEMGLEQFLVYVLEKTVPCRDSVCNKLFKSTTISGCFFDERYRLGEDCLFLFDSCGQVKRVCHIDNVFYHYYFRASGLSKIRDLSKRITTLPAHDHIAQVSKAISPDVYARAQAGYLDICLQYVKHPAAKKALREHLFHNAVSFFGNPYISWKLKTVYCLRAFALTK